MNLPPPYRTASPPTERPGPRRWVVPALLGAAFLAMEVSIVCRWVLEISWPFVLLVAGGTSVGCGLRCHASRNEGPDDL
jgi:hypothetical protein